MKQLYTLLLAALALSFAACADDEGNYDYNAVDEIKIDGLPESVSKNLGEVLEIDPQIESKYTDLKYEWYMWDRAKEDLPDNVGRIEGYEPELIGTEKKLAYEVKCPVALYTIMLKVYSQSTGYFSMASMRFDAKSEFTRGFYILKETEDGNTELDLSTAEGKPTQSNIFQITGRQPMQGKPLFLSHVASHSFINSAREREGAHTLCVTTEAGDVGFYETKSMQKVHDRSELLGSELPAGQKAYAAFTALYDNMLLTSQGVYMNYFYAMMQSTGAFYMLGKGTNGGSVFVFSDTFGRNVFFWDEQHHTVANMAGDGFSPHYGEYDNAGFSTADMKCLACGIVQTLDKGYFILEDSKGKRFLHEVSTEVDRSKPGFPVTKHLELDPNSRLAQATEYATNERTASYLYYVYQNKVYLYNLTTYQEEEAPLNLPDLPADENITYLSYQWQDYQTKDGPRDDNFTYLIVGTQQGENYHLYMYELEIGRPTKMVRKIDGKGKLKMCLYMTQAPYTFGRCKYSITN